MLCWRAKKWTYAKACYRMESDKEEPCMKIVNTEEFNALGSWEEKYAFIEKGLTAESMAVFAILPQTIQQQLFLERDPHGNVQVSLIESENCSQP